MSLRVIGSRAFALAMVLVTTAAAQPVKQERRTVAWHADLLRELWLASRSASAEVAQQMDRALVTDQAGNPFAPLARAFAARAGVDFDLELLTRLLVHVNALPEIVDPEVPEDGDPTTPYRLHVTLHTPLMVAETRPFQFKLRLVNAAGKDVWSGAIEDARAQPLAQFEYTVAIPVHVLPDGRYEVRVEATIGESAPRPQDVPSRAVVHVQRGFARRALQMADRAADAVDKLTGAQRCVLRGAVIPVQRVYTGEAFDGAVDVGADMEHAQRVIANLDAGRPLLDGARGFVSLGIETGGSSPQQAQVRWRVGAAAAQKRPLIVFVDAPPTWDGAWSRPSFARQRPPGFTARLLADADFDSSGAMALAVVGANGDAAQPVEALEQAIDTVAELAAVDRSRIVVVAEREATNAAFALARRWAKTNPLRAIVAVSGGALAREEIGVLAKTRLLLIPGAGHGSQDNLERVVRFAADANSSGQLEVHKAAWAWPWALAQSLSAIEAFAVKAVRD